MQEVIYSFPPNVNADVRVLILGSMPSAESLAKSQYYAHKRNAFWPIMGKLFQFDPGIPYSGRLQLLLQNHIALWDVVASCRRTGSADSAISGPVFNNIPALLQNLPHLRRVFCNGTFAAKMFQKLKVDFPAEYILRLPSTSPAYAAISFETKLNQWRKAFESAGFIFSKELEKKFAEAAERV